MVSPVSSEHRDARPIRLLILGGTDIASRSMLPLLITDTAFQSDGRRSYATSERALNAELVVVTVNALDIDNMQLRRGAYIARLLGMPSLTIAVTNMDAVDYSQSRFDEMVLHCRDAISDIGIEQITTVPLSTHDNDNIATPSRNMPWYVGSTLFDYLDTAPLAAPSLFQGFRILMQESGGHEGTVVGGTIKVDEPVVVMPSGVRSSIQSIYIDQDQSESAEAGMTVAISLADDIAMSGRDIICHGDHEMLVTDQVQAHVIWESAEPMIPGRQYVIKLANQSATAWVSELKYTINVSSMEHIAAKTLEENDIGVCNLSLDRRLACDAFSECRDTGAFVLIDRFADDVVGHGAIDFSLRRARNLTLQSLTMNKQARARAMGQKPIVIWFTGLSGSGKSTVANAVEDRLFEKGHRTYLLDGDNVRHGLNRDLGFTEADRVENIRRFGEVAKLFADAGLIVLVSVISPFRGERDMVRDLLDDGEFVEVFVDASLATCEKRDPKGLYARARKGEIQNFTGIDSPYEVPLDPELVLDTDKLSPDAAADQVIALIEAKFLEDQS